MKLVLGLDFKTLPDEQAEAAIFTEMQAFDHEQRLRYAQVGLMVREVKQRGLWKHRLDPATGLLCGSWTGWLRLASPYAYSTAHAALSDIEALADMPVADIAQIPQSNFHTLRQLSTSVRSEPSVLYAAKNQCGQKFVETIRQSHPHQHIQAQKRLRLSPNEIQLADIQEAVELAIKSGDASNATEAVWMWAIAYKQAFAGEHGEAAELVH